MTTAAALVVTGLAVDNTALVAAPSIAVFGWMFFRIMEAAERATPGPRRGSYRMPALPTLTLVYQAKTAIPHPEPLFVQAVQLGTRDPWFTGGGIGLSRDGMITAADGRGMVKAWKTQTGGVIPGLAPSGPLNGSGSGSESVAHGALKVVELAAVGDKWSIRAVHLRNRHGEQLAALPAVGLDGRRLAALARAAGIHYCRYEATFNSPFAALSTRIDYFPLAPSFSLFVGPGTAVSLALWSQGEVDAASWGAGRA